jgi:acyl-CoA synthetase (NDP forming)
MVDLPRMVAWATQIDHQRRDGLVATTGPADRIVAHGGWEREAGRPERAEIAMVIADACEAAGLQVPTFSTELRSRLAAVLPDEAATANPVDLLAAAPPERYQQAIELAASSGEADAMIVIHIPPFAGVHGTDQIAAAIHQADERVPAETTMLAVLMTTADAPAELRGGSRRIPCYAFPEEAARALARAAERGQWLRHPDTPLPELPGIRHDEAAALVAHALADGPRWLTVEEAARLLGCYGLPLAEWRLAHTTEKAGEMAEELGGPVALKATAPGLLHKTEAGAVRLNLKGRQEVTRAAGELAEVLTASEPTGGLPAAADGHWRCRTAGRSGPRPHLRSRGGRGCRRHQRRAAGRCVRLAPLTETPASCCGP